VILYFDFETFAEAFHFIHFPNNRLLRLLLPNTSRKNSCLLVRDTYQCKASYYLAYLCKICKDIY
jgi:hypothetical protein